MAFRLKDLGVLAYARGFTYWYYRTEQTAQAVMAPDYFADASDMLRVSDRITGSTRDRKALDLVVTKNDGKGVHVEVVGEAA